MFAWPNVKCFCCMYSSVWPSMLPYAVETCLNMPLHVIVWSLTARLTMQQSVHMCCRVNFQTNENLL